MADAAMAAAALAIIAMPPLPMPLISDATPRRPIFFAAAALMPSSHYAMPPP